MIDSLESSLWYFWRKKNYSGNDLGIINLEGETDTGAPQKAGSQLYIYYGKKSIPEAWLSHPAHYEDSNTLTEAIFASKDQFEKGCPLPVSIYASKLFTNCRHPSVQIA